MLYYTTLQCTTDLPPTAWTYRDIAMVHCLFFFNPTSGKPQHALLNLEHRHTGEVFSMSLEKCLTHWEIPRRRFLQIISDNGTNMVKAVNMLRERGSYSGGRRSKGR